METHLFIIWNRAENWRDKIIENINKKFKIIKVYEISWQFHLFSNNLARLYGPKLPPNSPKEIRIGRGPFTLIIVEDKKPIYRSRQTRGNRTEIVNTNMFDSKTIYRKWTKKETNIPDLIHATNTVKESNRDLTLLLGANMNQYIPKADTLNWKGDIEKLSLDIVGSTGWENLESLLKVLNATSTYVVLRNFEDIPHKYISKEHGDIDLLVDNYDDACSIINAKPLTDLPYRVLNHVDINGILTPFDLRHVGDNYYDINWEADILDTRVLDANGFFKPNPEHHFYSLMYHAYIQKSVIAPDYKIKLNCLANHIGVESIDKSLLDTFMVHNNYSYIKPIDKSVKYIPEIMNNKKKLEILSQSTTYKIYYKMYKIFYPHQNTVWFKLLRPLNYIFKKWFIKNLIQP